MIPHPREGGECVQTVTRLAVGQLLLVMAIGVGLGGR